MSLQISAGHGSLLAIGMGISDIATIYSLGRRFGNWVTANSGDREFLDLLELDELDILHRRGIMDTLRWNKKWSSQMSLLVNGKPTIFQGQAAHEGLEKLGLFSAVMVCTVAALDAFLFTREAKSLLYKLLLELLRTTEYGEDILASHFDQRFNSWRSSATVRGLVTEARKIRRELLQDGMVQSGQMPIRDSPHVLDMLYWLLSGNAESYTSVSTDAAGIALCLSRLGIDILSVSGLGHKSTRATPCQLRYNSNVATIVPGYWMKLSAPSSRRGSHTILNLKCLEEAFTNFPIDSEDANRCRMAWIEGQKAAKYVACRLISPRLPLKEDDLEYAFYDVGEKLGRVMKWSRVRPDIHKIVSAHAFIVNHEICEALSLVFQHEPSHVLDWLVSQTDEPWGAPRHNDITTMSMKNKKIISTFTTFQAFFLGYYYGIFLPLVDTSQLQLETVDGRWGFRCTWLLRHMRLSHLVSQNVQEQGIRILRRKQILAILSALFLGDMNPGDDQSKVTYTTSSDDLCVGVVHKRAILAKSLVQPCRGPRDIGSFVLLDVDVSGIPVKKDGWVHTGVALFEEKDVRVPMKNLQPVPLPVKEDITLHIEPDWEGDPETILICVRYKGRRIRTINPAHADFKYLRSLRRPLAEHESPNQPQEGKRTAVEEITLNQFHWSAEELINSSSPPIPTMPHGAIGEFQHLQQQVSKLSLPHCPRLRYYLPVQYDDFIQVHISTNSTEATTVQAHEDLLLKGNVHFAIVVGGMETEGQAVDADEWCDQDIENRINDQKEVDAGMLTSVDRHG
ncbi:hypothetical protein EJ04DRAFT_606095 [Polyplosphaeria fusca]|uniref:Uncharacterized protein n=1 Tax=Polyplosphaeria fusca TaxID=682080 RepID=A0A9P4RA11_9PLEO|nr:hypothetical protein EJ04DRAFT_606095 [Polyplosphaeria fusca]